KRADGTGVVPLHKAEKCTHHYRDSARDQTHFYRLGRTDDDESHDVAAEAISSEDMVETWLQILCEGSRTCPLLIDQEGADKTERHDRGDDQQAGCELRIAARVR